MSIYGKLAKARKKFHALELKKSGHNKFAGYKYFELGDFVIPGMDCLEEEGLIPIVSYGEHCATMTVYEIDGDATITITCPNSEAHLKGCHPIQNSGAVQTYQRRYLWFALLEIVEHDQVDAAEPRKTPADRDKDAKSDPATPEQMKKIKDHEKAGEMPARTTAWLEQHDYSITFKQASDILSTVAGILAKEAA